MCQACLDYIMRSTEILVYLIADSPYRACMLLLWLKCAESGDVPMSSYVFENNEVTLKYQGLCIKLIESESKVNSRECMNQLTELLSRFQ